MSDIPSITPSPDSAAPQPSMPADYGQPAQELQAARHTAAFFDLGCRTALELTGKDRQKFLHNFCTNEIRSLAAGMGCEAFLTTIQGKIKAHLFVFAEDESLWIDAVPGYEDLLYTHLDKYLISEDVQFHRRSADLRSFYVTGPEALTRLLAAGLPVAGLGVNRHCQLEWQDIPVRLRRVDWLGGPGLLVVVSAASAESLQAALMAAGLQRAGRNAFDVLRIGAGFPEHGRDLTEDNLAQEAARTSQTISFNKGCYLGQEPIARIDAMGHVNQELRGLKLAGGPVPNPASQILLPGEVRDAGRVTSGAWDYDAQHPVAMALLKRNYLSPGVKLHVNTEGQGVEATVFQHDI